MSKELNIGQIVGQRIQKIRRAKGLTQQQLAEMVGISTNYLSDVERGKSSARIDKLVAIINALGCSADDVFADVINVNDESVDISAANLTPKQLNLINDIIKEIVSNK